MLDRLEVGIFKYLYQIKIADWTKMCITFFHLESDPSKPFKVRHPVPETFQTLMTVK